MPDSSFLYINSLLALMFIVGIIMLMGWVARRYGLDSGALANLKQRRLSIVESLPVAGKRRLMVLKRDDKEYLVLVGGEHDLLLDSDFTAPAKPSITEGDDSQQSQ